MRRSLLSDLWGLVRVSYKGFVYLFYDFIYFMGFPRGKPLLLMGGVFFVINRDIDFVFFILLLRYRL